jgi:hypothetical protein
LLNSLQRKKEAELKRKREEDEMMNRAYEEVNHDVEMEMALKQSEAEFKKSVLKASEN